VTSFLSKMGQPTKRRLFSGLSWSWGFSEALKRRLALTRECYPGFNLALAPVYSICGFVLCIRACMPTHMCVLAHACCCSRTRSRRPGSKPFNKVTWRHTGHQPKQVAVGMEDPGVRLGRGWRSCLLPLRTGGQIVLVVQ
jgi:hypothetical protein